MANYTKGRFPASYNEFTTDEQERLLNIVVQFFDITWLESNIDNPIARLWKRTDQIATWELLTLAISLEKINGINSDWLSNQMKETI